MPNDDQIERALLQWLESFGISDFPGDLTGLSDGRIIWTILQIISPGFFTGPLPETTSLENWIRRWQNLKHIDRTIRTFVRDECGRVPNWAAQTSTDLKAVASNGSVPQTLKFLRGVLLAAVFSPDYNQKMVASMERLGPKIAKPIASCVEEIIKFDLGQSDISPEFNTSASIIPQSQSPATPIRAQRAPVPDIVTTDSHDSDSGEDEAPAGTAGVFHGSGQRLDDDGAPSTHNLAVKVLEDRMETHMNHIAALEHDLENVRSYATMQTKQLERLQKEERNSATLLEQLEMLRQEKDNLAKELADLEAVPGGAQMQMSPIQDSLIKEADTITQLPKPEFEEYNRMKDRNRKLEKINKENLEILLNSEQALLSESSMRKHLEDQIKQLTQALRTTSERDDGYAGNHRLGLIRLDSSKNVAMSPIQSLGNEIDDFEHSEEVMDTMAENARLKLEIARLQALQSLQEAQQTSDDDEDGSIDTDEARKGERSPKKLVRTISARAAETNDTVLQLIKEGKDALMRMEQPAQSHKGFPGDIDQHISPSLETGTLGPPDPSIELIQRELKFMTNAWYNVTKRIQSDAVVVQRRQHAPRSFLNRQRKLLRVPELLGTSNIG